MKRPSDDQVLYRLNQAVSLFQTQSGFHCAAYWEAPENRLAKFGAARADLTRYEQHTDTLAHRLKSAIAGAVIDAENDGETTVPGLSS